MARLQSTATTTTTTRLSLSNLQTQAMVSLLCTVGTHHSIDLRVDGRHLLVTVWRNGDPTTWSIHLDGTTKEV